MRNIEVQLKKAHEAGLFTQAQVRAIIALFERTRCVDIPDEHLAAVRELCERK